MTGVLPDTLFCHPSFMGDKMMTFYVCEECGSRSRKQTWCPEHPYAVLTEENTMTDNEKILDNALSNMADKLTEVQSDLMVFRQQFDAVCQENAELRQKLDDENAANIDSSFSTEILLRDNTKLREELEQLRGSYVSLSTTLHDVREELRNAKHDRDTYYNRLALVRSAAGST
jgi:hypothetical protein